MRWIEKIESLHCQGCEMGQASHVYQQAVTGVLMDHMYAVQGVKYSAVFEIFGGRSLTEAVGKVAEELGNSLEAKEFVRTSEDLEGTATVPGRVSWEKTVCTHSKSPHTKEAYEEVVYNWAGALAAVGEFALDEIAFDERASPEALALGRTKAGLKDMIPYEKLTNLLPSVPIKIPDLTGILRRRDLDSGAADEMDEAIRTAILRPGVNLDELGLVDRQLD